MEFDWDEANLKHLLKDNAERGISQQDVESVLSGDSVCIYDPPETVRGEERWVDGGVTPEGRLIFVVWTWMGDKIRPITAWDPDKKDKRLYERRRKEEYGE